MVVVEAGIAVVSAVAGMGLGLWMHHRKHFVPKDEQKDIWKHLEEISQQRSELSAKKRALIGAYKSGNITENVYLTKDAHYTELLEGIDYQIDGYMERLGAMFLTEEEKKSEKKLEEVMNVANLNHRLKEVKGEFENVKSENEALQVHLAEVEDERKDMLAKKNRYEEKSVEKQVEEEKLQKKLKKTEAEKLKVQEKYARAVPKDERETALLRENKMLRKSLNTNRHKASELEREMRVLEKILGKYRDEIEKGEARTPTQLKKLVQPKNKVVKESVKAHSSPRAAYEFVRDDIAEAPAPVENVWLTPEDVFELRAGDNADKAVFLCSMLRSMGKKASVVVVEMKNGHQRALVEFEDRLLALEEHRKWDDLHGVGETSLKQYVFDGEHVKKKLFEFSDEEYRKF